MSYGTNFFHTLILFLGGSCVIALMVGAGAALRWDEDDRDRPFPRRLVVTAAAVVAACAVGILLSVARVSYLDDQKPDDTLTDGMYVPGSAWKQGS